MAHADFKKKSEFVQKHKTFWQLSESTHVLAILLPMT